MRRPAALLSGLLLTASLLAIAAPAAAAPKTRWVDDDGHAGPTGCKGTTAVARTIQRAVDRSAAGDIVKVCPGTYVGDVVVATKRLRLEAVKALKATIKAAPDHLDAHSLVLLSAPGIRLNGFRIQALTAAPCTSVGAMIAVQGANNAVLTADRTETVGSDSLGACGYRAGISITDASGVKVSGGVISNFKMAGVDISGATSFSVSDVLIAYEHAGEDQPGDRGHVGLIAQSGSSGTVQRVTISTLPTAGSTSPLLDEGITLSDPVSVLDSTIGRTSIGVGLLDATAAATIDGNTITDSASKGILLSAGATGATVSDNTITGADEYGILMSSGSGNTFTGNTVSGSGLADCYDETTGSGDEGTANTWAASNHGPQDEPDGICPAP